MRSLILILFCWALPMLVATAEDIPLLEDIPKDCHNNDGLNTAKGSEFQVGPLWVQKCDNVCEFNSGNTITRRKTVWYPATVCAGAEGNVITRVKCMPDSRADGCFQPVLDSADPRNHDCLENPAPYTICITTIRRVACSYKSKDQSAVRGVYVRPILTARCASPNN